MSRQRKPTDPATYYRPASAAGRPLSHAERGRLGGLTTAHRHGRAHMAEIGRRGGLATVEAHGAEHMAEIGARGFESFAQRFFAGDRAAAADWVTRAGLAAIDPFPANGVWQTATPLPDPTAVRCSCGAWVAVGAEACGACGAPEMPF